MNALRYRPVGDPTSTDPFEWAQARMPDGWHVEGQVLPMLGGGHEARATKRTGEVAFLVKAVGYTMGMALANLPRVVRMAMES